MGHRPFDHHSAAHAVDPVAVYRRLRDNGGVETSELYGGFTVFSTYPQVTDVLRQHENFSSALELPGGDGFGGGVTLPRNPAAGRMSLSEMDPPEWRPVRRLLNPMFTPEAVARFLPRIREITTERIDRFITKGQCDLVLDLTTPVPAIVTLELLGMDTAEWERWADPMHKSVYTPRDPDNPEYLALAPTFEWMFQQLRDEIARRRENPSTSDDILNAMMTAEDDDGLMTDDFVFETAYTLLVAGVETTGGLLSSALWHLDKYPDDRQRLIDDPSLIPLACEEVLRYYAPSQGLARTVTCPVSIGGHQLERGDRVFVSTASANRDPAQFERPDEFIVDRRPNRQIDFGFGIHRCIGATLARQEFEVVIGEVLRRLPDYKVDHSESPLYPDLGLMYGYQKMPATFTPQASLTVGQV